METAVAVDFQHCIQMLEKREETEISKNNPALEHHSQYPSQIKSFHFIFKSKSIHIITPLIESISNCEMMKSIILWIPFNSVCAMHNKKQSYDR